MSAANPQAVFLSYASQDAAAAQRICDALRAAGVEVWFDRNELVGGDSWDQKIRGQVKSCALFIPIVSAATQARREGYFRLEWKLADDRTHLMAKGTPFLVPVCVDDTKDWDALVPDSFMTVQWTRLPGGETTPKFCERVQALLRGEVDTPARPRSAPAPALASAPAAAAAEAIPEKKIPMWPLAIGAVLVVGLALIFGLRPAPPAPAPVAPAAKKEASAAVPAAVDFPRDPDLRRAHQLLYGLDTIAEDFALAEDIVKPLLAARPNDPEVVTVAAEISQEYLSRGFDLTPARRTLAQRLTERAVALAPDSAEALSALARYLLLHNSQLGRAEELLRRAIKLKPNEPRFHRTLFYVLTFGKATTAEGDAFGAQMAARFPNDPLVAYDIARRYKDRDELGPMEQWFDKTLAIASLGSALVWKAWIALEIHGDLAGMKSWLDRVPDRQRASARVVTAAYVHAMFSGETATAIQLLNNFGDSWMTDFDFTGPKALLHGDLLRRDGREELARLQYETGLAESQRVLARDPTDWRPRRAEMLALLALGRREEARADLRLVLQALPRPYRWGFNNSWVNSPLRAGFLMGERELALTMLKEVSTVPQTRAILRNLFRLDPSMASFRDDPEIVALLAEPKKEAAPAALSAVPAAVDEKSVAVLAFANVGGDKDNEIFSDGISEELINALGRVPGLTVKGRASSFFFKGSTATAQEKGQRLGAAYLVDGSVRRSGDTVRITAQLIRAATDEVVWSSEALNRPTKDVFAVQEEIAGLIARNISPKLTQGVSTGANRTVDPEAFQLYLEGRALATTAGIDNLKKAIALFERAVQRDPGFHLAQVQAARAYIALGRWGGLVPQEAWAAAKAALAPALAAQPDLPEVLVAQGWLLRTADWKWREAEQAFARALAQRPSDTDVLVSAAVLKAGIGKSEEAHALARRAVELDPLNPATQLDLGLIHAFGDRLPEAERQFRRAIELSPGGQRYRTYLALTVVALGRPDEAEELARNEPDEISRSLVFGLCAAGRRDQARLREIIAQLDAKRPTLGKLSDYFAYVAALRGAAGDLDGGMAELEAARAAHDPSIGWIKTNYMLRSLHRHPRWPEFLRSLGLADDQLK